MTLPTSSRSASTTTKARGTRRTPDPETTEASGPPPIEDSSGSTSWMVLTYGQDLLEVVIPGGENGRISVGGPPRGSGNECRFYRNQTTKTYDAIIPDVSRVWKKGVVINRIGNLGEAAETTKPGWPGEDEPEMVSPTPTAVKGWKLAARKSKATTADLETIVNKLIESRKEEF